MKKRFSLIACVMACLIMMLLCACGAQAEALAGDPAEDALEEATQFPFLAETHELAVNVRAQADTRSEKVGRLERGMQLTVTGAEISADGELFYCVCMEDGTQGFVRSDLLLASKEPEEQQEDAQPSPDEAKLIGNRNSRKYHEIWCHSLPAEKNRVYFNSAEEAEKEGYVHCRSCD
ncbi:MAG: SH3 domain-containing protein [Clostridia bacterium]|nr:SH3 domain-containing protein [Clostridia bacterium]